MPLVSLDQTHPAAPSVVADYAKQMQASGGIIPPGYGTAPEVAAQAQPSASGQPTAYMRQYFPQAAGTTTGSNLTPSMLSFAPQHAQATNGGIVPPNYLGSNMASLTNQMMPMPPQYAPAPGSVSAGAYDPSGGHEAGGVVGPMPPTPAPSPYITTGGVQHPAGGYDGSGINPGGGQLPHLLNALIRRPQLTNRPQIQNFLQNFGRRPLYPNRGG